MSLATLVQTPSAVTDATVVNLNTTHFATGSSPWNTLDVPVGVAVIFAFQPEVPTDPRGVPALSVLSIRVAGGRCRLVVQLSLCER